MLHHVIHLSPCLTGTSLAAPGPPPPSAPEKPMNCFHQVFEQIRDSQETTSPHSLKQTCQPSPNARKPSSLVRYHFPGRALKGFFGDYFCSGCLSFADSGELEELKKTKKAGFPRPFRHTTKFEQKLFRPPHTLTNDRQHMVKVADPGFLASHQFWGQDPSHSRRPRRRVRFQAILNTLEQPFGAEWLQNKLRFLSQGRVLRVTGFVRAERE